MTDRLDRIERLLETMSTRQADMQASQQSTQRHLDSLAASVAELRTRQITTQNQLDNFAATAVATNADLTTRQITTQNQIDSLTALVLDNRQSIAFLGYRSVNHEGRLDELEGQGEVE